MLAARAFVALPLLTVLGACCFTAALAGYEPTCIEIDERRITGDATHLVVPFALMDDENHRVARAGHVRVEVRDLPPAAASIEQGTVVCAFERDVSVSEYSALYPELTIEATFSPPCPPPPPTSTRLERQAAFWFTSPTTSFPPFPIRSLPPALQNQTE